MKVTEVNELFSERGGKFVTPSFRIAEKLPDIVCLIFDWDGVFNNGQKSVSNSSSFSEVDSMGINMLRFSIYLRMGIIPECFVVTGESNPLAIRFARREHFNGVYFRCKDKSVALDHICKTNPISPEKCAFFFDDILDLDVASNTLLRVMVGRDSSPLLQEMAERNGLADYITFSRGGEGAIREGCEMLIGLNHNYEEVIEKRIEYTGTYLEYITARNSIPPHFFEFNEGQIDAIKVTD
jgi:3-deoxy-D-manno-octulosonate 8-phosphate phosphatase (KDO 8-P phosphatase)